MYRYTAFFIFIIIYLEQVNAVALSRQKRCIVIQKQSGTYNDGDDGEDNSYDRSHGRIYGERNHLKDTEPITSEFLRYNVIPTNKIGELLRIRNKLKTFTL